MKKILLTLVMALATTGMALAQQGDNKERGQRPDPAQMAQRMTEQMAQRYGLDDKQQANILELNKQYAPKMPMMRGGRPGGRPGMRGDRPGGMRRDSTMAPRQRPSKEEMEKRFQEMRANREAYNAEVKKIMTTDQYKKFTEDQERRGRRN